MNLSLKVRPKNDFFAQILLSMVVLTRLIPSTHNSKKRTKKVLSNQGEVLNKVGRWTRGG